MISIAYIKVALVIHMVFTVFMISNAKLLPLQEGGLIDIKTIFKVSDSNFIVQLFSRFLFRGYALLYIAGVALLIVLAIFKTILLDPIYNLCCGSCCNRKSATQVKDVEAAKSDREEESAKEDFTYSDDFFRDLKIKALKDIHSKVTNEIQDFQADSNLMSDVTD
jgi:hypothetical protein